MVSPKKSDPIRVFFLEADDILEPHKGFFLADSLIRVWVDIIAEKDKITFRILCNGLPPEIPPVNIRNNVKSVVLSICCHV